MTEKLVNVDAATFADLKALGETVTKLNDLIDACKLHGLVVAVSLEKVAYPECTHVVVKTFLPLGA